MNAQQSTSAAGGYDGSVVFEARLDTSPFEAGVAALGASLAGMIAEMSGVSTAALQVGETILLSLSGLPSETASLARSAADGFLSPFETMPAAAGSVFASLKSSVMEGLSSLPADLMALGKNAMDGLLSAVSSGAAGIGSALSGALQNALAKAKDFLEIRSPSRVMAREVGVPMTQGIAQGLSSAVPDLESALQHTLSLAVQSPSKQPAIGQSSTNTTVQMGGIHVQWNGGSQQDADLLAHRLGQKLSEKIRSSGMPYI